MRTGKQNFFYSMEYNSKYVKVVQNRLEAMVPLGQKVLLNNQVMAQVIYGWDSIQPLLSGL